jgi:putative copper export protein
VTAAAPTAPVPLAKQLQWWTLIFPAILAVALIRHDFRLLNWIHVLAGALWTGADIFMGFILQKPAPDRALIGALNRFNLINAGAQGVMQVSIIVVMAHFAVG